MGLSSSANGAALASIRIDSLTSHGTLTLNDVAVTSSQVILAADIANLKFTPTTDYSGSDSYTYSVNDGIAWSASPTTMNITITPSNDAPVLVDGQPTSDKNCDGLAVPTNAEEAQYALTTPRGPRVLMLFAQTK